MLFLHRVVPGHPTAPTASTWRSWPGSRKVCAVRAQEVLRQLERQELKVLEAAAPGPQQVQLGLFPPVEDAVLERLRKLEVERLTPIEALNLLAELKREAGE